MIHQLWVKFAEVAKKQFKMSRNNQNLLIEKHRGNLQLILAI